MIKDKDIKHIIFDNMVRTRILISSEHMTDGTMDSELTARAINKHRIVDMIYGKELKEIETLVVQLNQDSSSSYTNTTKQGLTILNKINELLRIT